MNQGNIANKEDAVLHIKEYLAAFKFLPLAVGVLHEAYSTICREMHADPKNDCLRLYLNGVLIVDVDR